MYRVLIVDDEPVIRNGIHSFIDWQQEGMSAEDDCANGVEALAALESRSIDILITDIKMPLMNGIQLMEQAIQLYPSLKVIMISSYNDFEYVREGLKLGAVDYLLKPTMEPEDLLAVLKRCIAMLEEERRKESELNQYQQGAIYRERKSLEHELKKLIVQEHATLTEADWVPAWLQERYACMYVMLDSADEWRENRGYLYVQLLLEELQEMFYMHVQEGVALLMSESSMFLILPDHDGGAEQLLHQWRAVLETKCGLSASTGFTIEHGIRRLLHGFANSRAACQRRFFEGLGGLYMTSGPESERTTQPAVDVIQDWTPFIESIRNGDPSTSLIECALERWRSGFLDPEQVKHEACQLLSCVYHLQADAGTLLPERLDLLQRAETLEQLSAHLIGQLEETHKPVLPNLTDKGYGGQIIMKALEYLAEHYTENLTLQGVADIVHLSKSYFSILFKKQTGRNFIDYLIELRIREAKRILAQKDSKIYDVADSSGFNDVKYFSKVFKKLTGLTPLQYREKHQVSESYFES